VKLAITFAFFGICLVLFGLLFFTTGGPCRVDSCGPSINEIAVYSGFVLIGAAVLRVVWAPLRSLWDLRRDGKL
jgi:hypothetical protein